MFSENMFIVFGYSIMIEEKVLYTHIHTTHTLTMVLFSF